MYQTPLFSRSEGPAASKEYNSRLTMHTSRIVRDTAYDASLACKAKQLFVCAKYFSESRKQTLEEPVEIHLLIPIPPDINPTMNQIPLTEAVQTNFREC